MTTPDRDDPERDAWLRAALAHAPDADIAAPAALSAAILRGAALPRRAAAPARWHRLLDAWSWLARPPVAAGFASVMVATVVGVMWWGRPIDEVLPRAPVPVRAAPPAAAASAEHAQVATTAGASRARLVLTAPPVQPPAAAANADAGSENAAAPAMTLRKAAPTSSVADEAKPSIEPPDLASRAPAPAPTPAPSPATAAAAAPATAPWPGAETASVAATEYAKADEHARLRAVERASAMRERRSDPRMQAEVEPSIAGRALSAAPAAPVADEAAREATATPATSPARAMSRGAAQPAAQDAAVVRAEDAMRAVMSPPATLLARWSAAAADWRWQAPGAIAPHPAGADARAWLNRLERATRGRWAAAPAPASNGTLAQWWQGDVAMGSVQFEAGGLRWLGPDGRAQFAPLDAATLAALRSF